jgi:hypothetical protein
MSETAKQEAVPEGPVVAQSPEEAPAAHGAGHAADILETDLNGPDVLVGQP